MNNHNKNNNYMNKNILHILNRITISLKTNNNG